MGGAIGIFVDARAAVVMVKAKEIWMVLAMETGLGMGMAVDSHVWTVYTVSSSALFYSGGTAFTVALLICFIGKSHHTFSYR